MREGVVPTVARTPTLASLPGTNRQRALHPESDRVGVESAWAQARKTISRTTHAGPVARLIADVARCVPIKEQGFRQPAEAGFQSGACVQS